MNAVKLSHSVGESQALGHDHYSVAGSFRSWGARGATEVRQVQGGAEECDRCSRAVSHEPCAFEQAESLKPKGQSPKSPRELISRLRCPSFPTRPSSLWRVNWPPSSIETPLAGHPTTRTIPASRSSSSWPFWRTSSSIERRPRTERRACTDVIATLRALTAECEVGTIERVRYFEGRLLTASDLNDEQRYHRDKLKRALLALHGTGIVKGLDVTIDGATAGSDVDVNISAGAAITPAGELLVIDSCRRCRLRVRGDAGFVVLSYTERETHPVPVPEDATLPQASRIEEGVGVTFDAVSPPDAVAIARLIRDVTGWRVDAKPPSLMPKAIKPTACRHRRLASCLGAD